MNLFPGPTKPDSPLFSVGYLLAVLLVAIPCVSGCGDTADSSGSDFHPSSNETAFIDTLQVRTFRYFWDLCNPLTGLAPDRAP